MSERIKPEMVEASPPWFKEIRLKDDVTAEVTIQMPNGKEAIYEISRYPLICNNGNSGGNGKSK
jgi:hypothetical protein